MAETVRITDPCDQRIDTYRDIRERDLVGRQGKFVAEGKVVLRALLQNPRFMIESILLLENRVAGLVEELGRVPADVPIYVASREIIDRIVGFPIHRGILAIGISNDTDDPAVALPEPDKPCLLVVCAGIANHDNIGSIFRNAAAFGADAVLLDEASCDPLYRKALRVSVGAALKLPFKRLGTITSIIEMLKSNNITPYALSPRGEELLDEVSPRDRAAIILGTEGDGLPSKVLSMTSTLRISMVPGFDSLNVAAASGIALHRFSRKSV